MNGIRHSLRFAASAVALVMLAGVAMPAAAQLCMVPDLLQTEEPLPCHGDGAGAPLAPVPERGVECCHVASDAVRDPAVLATGDDLVALEPLDRVALGAEIPPAPGAQVQRSAGELAHCARYAADLHLLYGAMLN